MDGAERQNLDIWRGQPRTDGMCSPRREKNGGKVIGVVPAKLEENGKVSTLLDEEIHTRNLSDRKDIITEKSEVLVALPGGVGTLDEIFHVIAAASIGYHRKRSSSTMNMVSMTNY